MSEPARAEQPNEDANLLEYVEQRLGPTMAHALDGGFTLTEGAMLRFFWNTTINGKRRHMEMTVTLNNVEG